MTDTHALVDLIDFSLQLESMLKDDLSDGKLSLIELVGFVKLIGPVRTLVGEAKEIPTEVSQLSPEDVVMLAGHIVEKLGVDNAKAQAILAASLSTVSSLLNLVKAIRG